MRYMAQLLLFPMLVKKIITKEEARQFAIDWQLWQSEQSLSYEQVADWQDYFAVLARQFGLTDEFRENGII
jgi:hypothetical protein